MVNAKQQSFLQAYKACHEPFLRYCSALAYGKFDVQDLVQDVLLAAYQQFEDILNKDQFLHYLIRTARNQSISFWRKNKYSIELIDLHAHRLKAKEVSPDVLLDIQLLYRMLDTLPTGQRDALILFEINGFRMKEIAEIQDSTEGAVKTKISRGRKILIERMKENPTHINQQPKGHIRKLWNSLKTIAL